MRRRDTKSDPCSRFLYTSTKQHILQQAPAPSSGLSPSSASFKNCSHQRTYLLNGSPGQILARSQAGLTSCDMCSIGWYVARGTPHAVMWVESGQTPEKGFQGSLPCVGPATLPP